MPARSQHWGSELLGSRVVGKLQEVFRVKRQTNGMNISLGSKRAAQEHLVESPGSWAGTESRHCEIWEAEWEEGAGRQVDANLSACLPIIRHCRIQGKREGGFTALLHSEGPPASVFISSSINNRLGEIKPLYPPGQATATLGGRVPRNFHTGDKLILSIRRDDRQTIHYLPQPGAKYKAQWVSMVSLLKSMFVL